MALMYLYVPPLLHVGDGKDKLFTASSIFTLCKFNCKRTNLAGAYTNFKFIIKRHKLTAQPKLNVYICIRELPVVGMVSAF